MCISVSSPTEQLPQRSQSRSHNPYEDIEDSCTSRDANQESLHCRRLAQKPRRPNRLFVFIAPAKKQYVPVTPTATHVRLERLVVYIFREIGRACCGCQAAFRDQP
jgi:hypothetical protein